MKKILIAAVIGAFITSSLTACDMPIDNAGTGNSTVKQSQNRGAANSKIVFEEIKDAEALPENVRSTIDALKQKRGFAYFKADDGFILFISLGEKNTGGYAVKVKSVEDIEGVTKVVVEEKVPKEGDIVTQAITYPFTIIKVVGAAENFQVADEKGEKFSLIKLEEGVKDTSIKADGVYVGQIDGSSVEIIANGEAKAFRHDEKLKPAIEKLKKDDKVMFSYFKNEHGQMVMISIEKIKD